MSIIKDNQSNNKELDSNQLNILNLNSKKKKPRASLKWVETLRNKKGKNSNKISANNKIFIKKGLKIEDMIDNAKIHREANRPLKKIKEFSSLTKFCQCCYLPVKDNIYIRNFKFCENTDEYAECGRGTSLYFSYYRFASLILLFTFILMGIPSLIVTNHYTHQLIDICYKIYNSEKGKINITYPDCLDFIDIGSSNFFNKDIVWVLKFNAINLRQYRRIYSNFSKELENVDKTIINYNFAYFIGLITLFIINLLYIMLLYNLNKQYDISVTSPSDYTVILTNMKSTFHIYWTNITKINKFIKKDFDNNNSNNFNYININDINNKNARNSQRIELKEVEELGLEEFIKNKNINIKEAFNEFIKNKICETQNKEKFNVYQINICYKITEFISIEEKIQKKKNEIYKIENDPYQREKNEHLQLKEKNRKYFYYPIDIFELNIFPFNIYEKNYSLFEIEEEKNKLERQLKELLKQTENLTEENFSGTIFVTFNSIKETERFLEQFPKNLIMNIFVSIRDLKYFLCCCFIDNKKKANFLLKRNISVDVAPEPEDVIFENLQFSSCQRLTRILFIYLVSIIIIFVCFIIILILNYVQIKHNQGDSNHKVILKYSISIAITLIISILNSIFRTLLDFLTKIEKQISKTNYYLSYSVKLTLFTFVTSGIIPLVSSYYYLSQVNYDILVTNMLTLFLSNSFLTPIMWSFNFEFLYKKLKICYVEKNKKLYTQKELNNLYELLDMGIAYKYSYIAKTLLMTFFYMPIFPLSVFFSLVGFIFGYFIEKFNFSKIYKKPEMLNSKICEFYSNYFILNFFMLCIGDYIFLRDTYKFSIWPMSNLVLFGVLLLIPYNQIFIFDFIGINESELKKNQNYEDYYFSFYNDYERNNPMTKKDGIKHFLDKLIENALISKKDYDTILQNFENINILETYYKARINFTHNLIQKAFLSIGTDETNIKKRRKSKFISNFKEFAKNNKVNLLTNLLFPGNIFGHFLNNDENNLNLMNNNEEEDENIDNNIFKGRFRYLNNNLNFSKNKRYSNNDPSIKIKEDSKNKLIFNINNKDNFIENSEDSKSNNNTSIKEND